MEGLRSTKKERTRIRLIEIALAKFEERGYDEVTVEEITDTALVSPRTFYRYFGSKEGALYDDQDHLLDLVRRAIVSHDHDDTPFAALRAGVLVLAEHAAQDVDLARRRTRVIEATASLGDYRRTTLVPRWEQAIAEAFAVRLEVDIDADVRPRLLAGVGIAVMISMGQTFRQGHGNEDLEALVAAGFADLVSLIAPTDLTGPARIPRPARTGTA